MSDTVLKIVPADREYMPIPEAQQKAVARLREMLPDGEMHQAEAFDELQFIDQGEYCEAVLCPSCGARVDVSPFTGTEAARRWWWEEVDAAIAGAVRVADLRTTMPCCSADVAVPSLRFDRPAGFARFQLSVWNPDLDEGRLTAAQLAELEADLDCRLVQIEARY